MTSGKGAPWSEDKMERRGIAKFLTKYLDSNAEINVLNVNAPWGAGKTFFLENWHDELLQERAALYFNAWKHDYAGDAFVALTAAIHDSLKELIPTSKVDSALSDFRSKAAKAILAATPAIAKGVLKKVTGVDVSAIAEEASSSVESDSDDLLPSAAEKALEALLQNNGATMRIVEDFKHKFSALAREAASAQAVNSGKDVRPLYVFIDELDRCRPTFSIELLERVKHFFDVENCKFIIACDLEQLQHSISAVYGEGFEGSKYLKRFFDAEYSLSFSNFQGWIKSQIFEDKYFIAPPLRLGQVNSNSYWGEDERSRVTTPSPNDVLSGDLDLDAFQAVVLAVSQTFKLKLRELEKCLKQLRAVQASFLPDKVDIFLSTYLICLRDEAPQLYRKVIEYNNSDDWSTIEHRYPARSIYYGYGSMSIHELAKKYFDLLHASELQLRTWLRSDDAGNALYSHALESFSTTNDRRRMKNYIPYVDLAHSID